MRREVSEYFVEKPQRTAMAFAGWFSGRAQGALPVAHVVTVATLAPAVIATVVDALGFAIRTTHPAVPTFRNTADPG